MIRPSSHTALKYNVAWFAWLLQWWWSRTQLLALSAGRVQGRGLLTWETWKVHICVPCVSYNMCHDYVSGLIFFKPTVFQREWAISANIRAHLPCSQWVHTPQCLLVLLSPVPLPQFSNSPGNAVRKGHPIFLWWSHYKSKEKQLNFSSFYYLKSPSLRIGIPILAVKYKL